jgi:hypothetical protein
MTTRYLAKAADRGLTNQRRDLEWWTGFGKEEKKEGKIRPN